MAQQVLTDKGISLTPSSLEVLSAEQESILLSLTDEERAAAEAAGAGGAADLADRDDCQSVVSSFGKLKAGSDEEEQPPVTEAEEKEEKEYGEVMAASKVLSTDDESDWTSTDEDEEVGDAGTATQQWWKGEKLPFRYRNTETTKRLIRAWMASEFECPAKGCGFVPPGCRDKGTGELLGTEIAPYTP